MQDTFQWTDDLVKEFFRYAVDTRRSISYDLEQFKASKSPKREWEIVAFSKNGTICNLIEDWKSNGNWTEPMFRGGTNQFSLAFGLDDTTACAIHSVRRLSDQVIFSVGHRIKPTPTAKSNRIIKSFSVSGSILKVHHEDGYFCSGELYWHHMAKLPATIPTTDGVEIKEGDEVWLIDKEEFRVLDAPHTIYNLANFTACPIFSTREAAETYVLNHAPKLSLNDVREAWGKDRSFVGCDWLIEQLTTLVQQKLNSK